MIITLDIEGEGENKGCDLRILKCDISLLNSVYYGVELNEWSEPLKFRIVLM